MSAYLVDRELIQYLLDAALSERMIGRHGGVHRWYHNDSTHTLCATDLNKAAQVAQMLWDANILSVRTRYHDADEKFDTDVRYGRHTLNRLCHPNPAQVLKACHCYAHQSCQPDSWNDSEAKAFSDALRISAEKAVIGYEEAEWGAPRSYYEQPHNRAHNECVINDVRAARNEPESEHMMDIVVDRVGKAIGL